jgi:ABC-type taurine transport system ATPase subunit
VNIDAKLAIFKGHLDSEKTKKADSITDEVRLENTKKKRATDLERTRKQRAAHVERGLAIETKLKELSVE